jgi:hypothetical protein
MGETFKRRVRIVGMSKPAYEALLSVAEKSAYRNFATKVNEIPIALLRIGSAWHSGAKLKCRDVETDRPQRRWGQPAKDVRQGG